MLRNANAHGYHIKPPSPVTTRSNGSVVSTQGYTLPVAVATPLHHTQRAFVTVPRAASACASVAWMTQRYFCSIARASRAHSFIKNNVQKFRSLRARRPATFGLFHLLHFVCHFLLLNVSSYRCFSFPFALFFPQLATSFGSLQRMASTKRSVLQRQARYISEPPTQGGRERGERQRESGGRRRGK